MMVAEILRQRIAAGRTPDIQLKAALAQQAANAAGRRVLLMEDDEDGIGQGSDSRTRTGSENDTAKARGEGVEPFRLRTAG